MLVKTRHLLATLSQHFCKKKISNFSLNEVKTQNVYLIFFFFFSELWNIKVVWSLGILVPVLHHILGMIKVLFICKVTLLVRKENFLPSFLCTTKRMFRIFKTSYPSYIRSLDNMLFWLKKDLKFKLHLALLCLPLPLATQKKSTRFQESFL